MANPNMRKSQYHVIHFSSKANRKYNRADLTFIDPISIPTLVPENVIKEWDISSSSYFKIQAIEFPIMANRYIYDVSFAHSYVNALKTAPMPGSKDGHEMQYGKRGKTDLLLIGGRVDEQENGKAIMYLKNFIPSKADTDNTNFIRECKSNMIHFSLVTYSRDVLKIDEKGNQEWHVVEHMSGGRNDAVDRGTGAMDQKTNKNPNTKIKSDESIKEKDKSAVGGRNINNGSEIMTKEELLAALTEHKNNILVLPEIIKTLGVEVVTDKHKNALKVMDEFEKIGVADPLKSHNEMSEEIKANAESVHAARLDKEFGISTKEKPNLLRDYAGKMIPLCSEKEFAEKVNGFKLDPIAKKFAEYMANSFSDTNSLGEVLLGDKHNNQATENDYVTKV